jgi:hypothetical protein
MTETHLEKRLIGYPRVSTYGQTSESQLAQLSRGWLSGRNTASTASKIELVGRDQRWRRSAPAQAPDGRFNASPSGRA